MAAVAGSSLLARGFAREICSLGRMAFVVLREGGSFVQCVLASGAACGTGERATAQHKAEGHARRRSLQGAAARGGERRRRQRTGWGEGDSWGSRVRVREGWMNEIGCTNLKYWMMGKENFRNIYWIGEQIEPLKNYLYKTWSARDCKARVQLHCFSFPGPIKS